MKRKHDTMPWRSEDEKVTFEQYLQVYNRQKELKEHVKPIHNSCKELTARVLKYLEDSQPRDMGNQVLIKRRQKPKLCSLNDQLIGEAYQLYTQEKFKTHTTIEDASLFLEYLKDKRKSKSGHVFDVHITSSK